MPELSVWIVGDWRHADFSEALAWLNDQAPYISFDDAGTAIASRRSGATDLEPAAFLLLQSRPGQITERDVQRLHAAAPLARLVALIGPWCEGEMRSGHPWPGVVRVPWRAWRGRLNRELGLAGAEQSSRSPPPRTATETERIETALSQFYKRVSSARTAGICTSSRANYESIANALQQFGIRSVWYSPESEASLLQTDLLVCDGWDQVPVDVPATNGSGQSSVPPRLLMLHFPRPEDVSRAAACGMNAVLAQPLLLTDLGAALDRLFLHPSAPAQSAR